MAPRDAAASRAGCLLDVSLELPRASSWLVDPRWSQAGAFIALQDTTV